MNQIILRKKHFCHTEQISQTYLHIFFCKYTYFWLIFIKGTCSFKEKKYFFLHTEQPTPFEKFSSLENSSNLVQGQKAIAI